MQYLQPGPAKALLVQASTEPIGYVGICILQIYLKELENDHQSGSSMFTAVDAVLVLHVSPARDDTKCRHSTQ